MSYSNKNDKPTSADKLGMSSRNEGLAAFIQQCDTPLTIAIQGNWGVGKTSAMKYVREKLEEDGVSSIWFNTWQFSAMSMDTSIFVEFLLTFQELVEKELLKIEEEYGRTLNDRDDSEVKNLLKNARKALNENTKNVGATMKAMGTASSLVPGLQIVGGVLCAAGEAVEAAKNSVDTCEKNIISRTGFISTVCQRTNEIIENIFRIKALAAADKIYEDFGNNKTSSKQKKEAVNNALNDFEKTVGFFGEKKAKKLSAKEIESKKIELEQIISAYLEEIAGIGRAATEKSAENSLNELLKEIKIVDAYCNKKQRLCIFVDDLDRLKPEMAIELLEGIKNFTEYDNCIFVLAIDKKAIKQGLKTKYGEEFLEEKKNGRCRDELFFDKIIQVPFEINEKNHDIKKYVTDIIGEEEKDMVDDYKSVLDFFEIHNPRSIKRYFNLTELYKFMMKTNSKDNYNEKWLEYVLFTAVVLQIENEELYKEICDEVIQDNEEEMSSEILARVKSGYNSEDTEFDKETIVQALFVINVFEKACADGKLGDSQWLKGVFTVTGYNAKANTVYQYLKQLCSILDEIKEKHPEFDFNLYDNGLAAMDKKELAERIETEKGPKIETRAIKDGKGNNITFGWASVQRPFIYFKTRQKDWVRLFTDEGDTFDGNDDFIPYGIYKKNKSEGYDPAQNAFIIVDDKKEAIYVRIYIGRGAKARAALIKLFEDEYEKL